MKEQLGTHLETGVTAESLIAARQARVQLFGHVTLVQAYGYGYAGYTGCYALVSLRDQPGVTVAVMTRDVRLQNLMELALSTGNLMYFRGIQLTSPPSPGGGTWSVDVYSTDNIAVYNFA